MTYSVYMNAYIVATFVDEIFAMDFAQMCSKNWTTVEFKVYDAGILVANWRDGKRIE